MKRYQVVRRDNGPSNPHTGVVSQHSTPEAAQAAIDRANVELRKMPGQALSWHPYGILDRVTGDITTRIFEK